MRRVVSYWWKVCDYCVSGGIPKRSGRVSLIVGIVLNLINQGDALLHSGRVNIIKLMLTFAVPYCVATYGAVSYRLTLEKLREKATDGAACPRCGESATSE